LLDSLGPPPLGTRSSADEYHLKAVIERASTVASALAASAGLLVQPDTE
jgi:hypothetical protein